MGFLMINPVFVGFFLALSKSYTSIKHYGLQGHLYVQWGYMSLKAWMHTT